MPEEAKIVLNHAKIFRCGQEGPDAIMGDKGSGRPTPPTSGKGSDIIQTVEGDIE